VQADARKAVWLMTVQLARPTHPAPSQRAKEDNKGEGMSFMCCCFARSKVQEAEAKDHGVVGAAGANMTAGGVQPAAARPPTAGGVQPAAGLATPAHFCCMHHDQMHCRLHGLQDRRYSVKKDTN
jgi:hypothetical protein